MKLSLINNWLLEKITTQDFVSAIEPEMAEYLSGSLTLGKSMPVYVVEDDLVIIGERELKMLTRAFLEDELSEMQLNYCADVLLLAEEVAFDGQDISDKLGYLTDPEVNGRLTKEMARDIGGW